MISFNKKQSQLQELTYTLICAALKRREEDKMKEEEKDKAAATASKKSCKKRVSMDPITLSEKVVDQQTRTDIDRKKLMNAFNKELRNHGIKEINQKIFFRGAALAMCGLSYKERQKIGDEEREQQRERERQREREQIRQSQRILESNNPKEADVKRRFQEKIGEFYIKLKDSSKSKEKSIKIISQRKEDTKSQKKQAKQIADLLKILQKQLLEDELDDGLDAQNSEVLDEDNKLEGESKPNEDHSEKEQRQENFMINKKSSKKRLHCDQKSKDEAYKRSNSRKDKGKQISLLQMSGKVGSSNRIQKNNPQSCREQEQIQSDIDSDQEQQGYISHLQSKKPQEKPKVCLSSFQINIGNEQEISFGRKRKHPFNDTKPKSLQKNCLQEAQCARIYEKQDKRQEASIRGVLKKDILLIQNFCQKQIVLLNKEVHGMKQLLMNQQQTE